MLEIHSGDNDKFDSACDQTMVGFVQEAAGTSGLQDLKAQCFYAIRDQPLMIEQTEDLSKGEITYAKINSHGQGIQTQVQVSSLDDSSKV